MRSCQLPAGKTLLLMAAALCLVTTAATSSPAQSRTSTIERRIDDMNRQRQQYDRETLRDRPGGKDEKLANQKSAQAIASQVKQDFERIQSVYNDIVIAMSASDTLDNRFVSEATTEIMKRASRLKTNLVLPAPQDTEQGAAKEAGLSDDQLKPRLKKLCLHIVSFVTNPLFETSGVLDIEQSTKASRDLESIIKVSESISKTAEKLTKSK